MQTRTAAHGQIAPIVSVIVPTVRLDDDFSSAIESLRAQTLEAIEIVIVLDGVADEHGRIPRDDRISVVALPTRGGTPAALNAGILASSGDYIARLDADDLAAPERLARQIAELDDRPDLVLLGSSAQLIDGAGARIGTYETPQHRAEHVLLRRNAFVHSSVVMRRSAVLAVGGYDERCNRMQDYDLWLRLARIGGVANLSDTLVSYRVHDGMHSRATRAFGPAARAVRASRVRLARHLGRSRVAQVLDDTAWTAAQVARSMRLRRPRYLTSG